MSLKNNNQKVQNALQRVGSATPSPLPTGEMAQIMQTQFVKAVRILRKGAAATAEWWINDGEDGAYRLLGTVSATSGIRYDPDFVCRAITTNDKNADGESLMVDMPETNKHIVRVYAGLDRPYRITRVYINENTNIQDIVLLK